MKPAPEDVRRIPPVRARDPSARQKRRFAEPAPDRNRHVHRRWSVAHDTSARQARLEVPPPRSAGLSAGTSPLAPELPPPPPIRARSLLPSLRANGGKMDIE